MRQILGRDARARVRHENPERHGVLKGAHAHDAAGGRVLHAVLQHVAERLGRPGGVACERRTRLHARLHGHAAQVERAFERSQRLAHEPLRVHGRRLHADGAGVDLRQLEERRHEPAHALDKALQFAQGAKALGVVARRLDGCDGQPDGRERRAYLMGHVCQRVGERLLLPSQALVGARKRRRHLRQLVFEDGQVPFAAIREVDAPPSVQDLVHLLGQPRDLAMPPRRERPEQRA